MHISARIVEPLAPRLLSLFRSQFPPLTDMRPSIDVAKDECAILESIGIKRAAHTFEILAHGVSSRGEAGVVKPVPIHCAAGEESGAVLLGWVEGEGGSQLAQLVLGLVVSLGHSRKGGEGTRQQRWWVRGMGELTTSTASVIMPSVFISHSGQVGVYSGPRWLFF